jgi:choice-of-anchor A domain-containing protein
MASALASTTSLGLDSGLNLLVFGNLSVSSSDVQGKVAVGGNAAISSYSIDSKNGSSALYSGSGLTVGGNLTFSSGSIQGDTRVGGTLTSNYSGSFLGNVYVDGFLNAVSGLYLSSGHTITDWGGSQGVSPWGPQVQSGNGAFNLGFDFAATQTSLDQLSISLGGSASTGKVSNRWGTIVLDASGLTGTVVFNLTAADAAQNLEIDGLAPNATAVINVAGSSINFGNHGYTNFSSAPGRILFNLPDATVVTFNGGMDASLLAPLATVGMGYGQINGQVVVANWYSSVQVNDEPFAGGLPVMSADFSGKVPEPATLPLALAGLVGIARLRNSRVRSLRATTP